MKNYLTEYSPTAAALADLRARLANVAYDLSTGKGMDIAKKDRAEVRGLRVALEAKRVELKAPALERSRLIDAEAKTLTAELVALEQPIDAQIKAEEVRKAAEKSAKEEAERQAAALISNRIDGIRQVAVKAVGMDSETIAALIAGLAETEITLEEFCDLAGEAQQVKDGTIATLKNMQATASAHEAEQARMEAERIELARLRAEQEAREKTERERIAVEKLAAERAAFEAEQATARAEAKKRDDADRARRDKEDRKAREARAAEDKRISDARAALEAELRAIREVIEAEEAAARKAAQDVADEMAAVERKRLDDEAAAARAEQQRIADEREKAMAAQQRVRDAAPALFEALKSAKHMLERDPIDCAKMAVIEQCDKALIEAAGGEE